jgi:hypothetical protein
MAFWGGRGNSMPVSPAGSDSIFLPQIDTFRFFSRERVHLSLPYPKRHAKDDLPWKRAKRPFETCKNPLLFKFVLGREVFSQFLLQHFKVNAKF